ncbi:UNVERIFIED_CONTAM: hypothetical protein FKN15_038376 [Acipenser sinensis]
MVYYVIQAADDLAITDPRAVKLLAMSSPLWAVQPDRLSNLEVLALLPHHNYSSAGLLCPEGGPERTGGQHPACPAGGGLTPVLAAVLLHQGGIRTVVQQGSEALSPTATVSACSSLTPVLPSSMPRG